MKFSFPLLLLFFVSLSCAAVTGSSEAGKAKVESCVACHGVNGNSVVPNWPKLAGQHESYLVKQLKEFQQGEQGPRNNPSMYGMVINLTEQDIADIAAYYAAEEQTLGQAKPEFVALGEKIYRGGNIEKSIPACLACHGPSGKGNAPAKYPRLSGQHSDYTELQLKAFRDGTRKNDPSGMMQQIAARMSDEEIKAVSSYIEGLH